MTDICANANERDAKDRALDEIRSRFAEMAENIGEVFYNYDPVRRCMLYVSPAYEAIWGRSRAEFASNPLAFLDGVHVDDQAIVMESLARQNAGEATAVRYRIVRPDGTIRWILDKSYAVVDERGAVTRVVGTAQDVTDQVAGEETLRLSEERFRLLARATNDAIWEWDPATNLLWWNDGFETLFGFRRDEVEPTLESWTSRIHPDDHDAVLGSLHAALEAGRDDWQAEYRFLRKDGSPAYVLDRGHAIRDAAGKPVRMIGGMTDMTERRDLQLQLLHSQKMDAIGRLAGGVAHDFNNLLMVILGYCDILLESKTEHDGDHKLLQDMRSASRRAADLTRQLLALSRKQVMSPQVLDLNHVVVEVEKLLRRLIGEDIHLASELGDELHPTCVDRGQLEQVLMNLAVNARDAMPRGGTLTIATRNVTIDYQRDRPPGVLPGEYVELTISDTGCGMPPEVRTKIFEPFFTTKEMGKGTGLGLSTVFGIVQQSGGTISVESEVGQGAKFRVLLPAAQPQPQRSVPPARPISTGCETVLLVEDEVTVRDLVHRMLRQRGYQVLMAAGGVEALKIYGETASQIDLVLTDVVMPQMNGQDLAVHLAALGCRAPVLFMSGYTDDTFSRHGLYVDPERILQKPFTSEELAARIRCVLDQSPRLAAPLPSEALAAPPPPQAGQLANP